MLIGTAKASSLRRNMELLGTDVPRQDFEAYRPYVTVQPPLTGAVRE